MAVTLSIGCLMNKIYYTGHRKSYYSAIGHSVIYHRKAGAKRFALFSIHLSPSHLGRKSSEIMKSSQEFIFYFHFTSVSRLEIKGTHYTRSDANNMAQTLFFECLSSYLLPLYHQIDHLKRKCVAITCTRTYILLFERLK